MKLKNILEHLEKNQYRWLITGAAGFIGSNLSERLVELKQSVIGIDNFSNGKKENIKYLIDNSSSKSSKGDFKIIRGDLADSDLCMKYCDGIDFVLHQAARGSVQKSIDDPIKTNMSNVTGFLNILRASEKCKVKKFIYASSSSVYGDHKDLPKKEGTIGTQLSPYAITKYVNELYANNFSKLFGIDTIGLRYFNVFGKRQDPNGDYAAVIPKWVDAIINNKKIEVYGDGETSRDFCYIENVIEANFLASFNNVNSDSKIFNVAYGERLSLNKLINIINEIVIKKTTQKKQKLDITFKDFRQGDVKHSLADISKIKNQLNYDPQFDIIRGLNEYIDHCLVKKEVHK